MSVTYFRLNRIEKGANNTLYFYLEDHEILTGEDMLALLEVLKSVADEVPFRVVFVLDQFKFYLTKDARNLYSTHDEAKGLFIAQAAVFSSLSTQILVDLMLRIYPPPHPLKAFGTLKEAEEWLALQETYTPETRD